MLILPAFNFWCWYARFIADIYETEEREESKQFINKIRLEFPKVFISIAPSSSLSLLLKSRFVMVLPKITLQVPQQNGEECGIYVLYFIQCFLQNKKLAEVLENKKLEDDFTQLVRYAVLQLLYLFFFSIVQMF